MRELIHSDETYMIYRNDTGKPYSINILPKDLASEVKTIDCDRYQIGHGHIIAINGAKKILICGEMGTAPLIDVKFIYEMPSGSYYWAQVSESVTVIIKDVEPILLNWLGRINFCEGVPIIGVTGRSEGAMSTDIFGLDKKLIHLKHIDGEQNIAYKGKSENGNHLIAIGDELFEYADESLKKVASFVKVHQKSTH